MDALAARFDAIEARLVALEAASRGSAAVQPPPPPPQSPVAFDPANANAAGAPLVDRLASELTARGVATFQFRRVPPDYYDHPLEWRRDALAAPSVAHLCKSLVLTNRAHRPPPPGARLSPAQVAATSEHWIVIVQYAAKFDAERLKKHVVALGGGAVAAKGVNLRLADPAVSAALTGYAHNAVTPVGLATPGVPVVLSAAIAELDPPLFWMGGGDVDLKLGVDTAQFVAAYAPFVLDVTHGSGGDGDGEGA